MNKVSFPPVGGFLVIADDIHVIHTSNTYGKIHVRPNARPRQGKWVDYPLLRGEWYEIKKVTYPNWGCREVEKGFPTIGFKLNRSKKGRVWVRDRINTIIREEFDEKATCPTIDISMKAMDLNGKTFLAISQQGAILCSKQLLGTTEEQEKVAPWKYLEF